MVVARGYDQRLLCFKQNQLTVKIPRRHLKKRGIMTACFPVCAAASASRGVLTFSTLGVNMLSFFVEDDPFLW